MDLYDEFFAIIEALEENEITYAVIGGFALAFHDKPRFTEDIDILVKSSEMQKTANILEKLYFFSSTDPHLFLNTKLILHRYVKIVDNDYLVLDILTGNDKRYKTIFENVINYDWEKGKVAVVSREDLVYLKKRRNSEQDKIDIKNLQNNEEDNG